MKSEWIVAIGNSAISGVIILKFYGTENEVEDLLLRFINEDKERDRENFDMGTETVDDIDNNGNGELNAYATYSDYHIEYTAKRYDSICSF